MLNRYIGITAEESKKLIDEYNRSEKAKLDPHRKEKKRVSSDKEVSIYARVLSELKESKGLLTAADYQKSFLSDVGRGYTIEGLDLRADPDYKAIAGKGSEIQDATIKTLIKRVWKLPDDKLVDTLADFHLQSFLMSPLSLAVLSSLKSKPDDLINFGKEKNYLANYYQKDGVVRIRTESWYHFYNNNEKIFEIPGRIICEFVLTPEGFKLEEGYPKFSNALLKKLVLAKPYSIHLFPEVIELAKIEENLREILQDFREWPIIDVAPADVARAFEVLEYLDRNLEDALTEGVPLVFKQEAAKLTALAKALTKSTQFTLSVPEYKALYNEQNSKLAEYKKTKEAYDAKLDAYIAKQSGKIPLARAEAIRDGLVDPEPPTFLPLSLFAQDVHANQGHFPRLPDDKETFVMDVFRSKWKIEGQAFSDHPESKLGEQGVKDFIKRQWNVSDDTIFNYLVRVHSQPLAQQVFSQAIQNAGFVPNRLQMDYSANYYKDGNNIYLQVEQRYTIPGEEKPFGTVQFNYVLTPPHDPKMVSAPRFNSANPFFKELFFRPPSLIALELDRVAKELEDLCVDTSYRDGLAIKLPESKSLPMANELLAEVNKNFVEALANKDTTYLSDLMGKLILAKNALIAERVVSSNIIEFSGVLKQFREIYRDPRLDHGSILVKSEDENMLKAQAEFKDLDTNMQRALDDNDTEYFDRKIVILQQLGQALMSEILRISVKDLNTSIDSWPLAKTETAMVSKVKKLTKQIEARTKDEFTSLDSLVNAVRITELIMKKPSIEERDRVAIDRLVKLTKLSRLQKIAGAGYNTLAYVGVVKAAEGIGTFFAGRGKKKSGSIEEKKRASPLLASAAKADDSPKNQKTDPSPPSASGGLGRRKSSKDP